MASTSPDPAPQTSSCSIPAVGGPFRYKSGPFAGRILRSKLEEVQHADRGRKYARKDKRPLDPPPVVRLRCFQTIYAGTKREKEKELDNFDEHSIFGFICHVDLIPLRRGEGGQPVALASQRTPAESITVPERFLVADVASGSNVLSETLAQPGFQTSAMHTNPETRYGEPCTSLLFGETFVPCTVVEYEGHHAALFVFSDLAVRQEGNFILRYRVFNISGHERCVPVLAECYGGSFEIFSTKTFPGLKASTDLTKTLSLNGLRVNSRYRERRSRKKARYTPDSPTSPGPGDGYTGMPASNPMEEASSSTQTQNRIVLPLPTPSAQSYFGGILSAPRKGLFDSHSQAAQAALDAWHERELREERRRSESRSPCSDVSMRS
ncbi:hypothetical protein L226DRAFT_533771 [Lentinus tigrinus ALCF2SS1-7]|uniref:Velvet domain-containing protein n=1 Tax=Lentinus tigrinus ALCF2SS1-6 TaxID=1328759 RepID=A0A5C2SLM9_9APHY|nr:hypothetical protein L227DRAFT_650643 [Lentinus tigrinus ALCF2SS1-6]RPD76723.1 hypothetical protein L226DRAFT_533771 [Lentinus tigrinus ALCF2SS1-7]